MNPPVKKTQQQIERMARAFEQTLARRRRLLKELRDVNQQAQTERKLLRDLIADVTAAPQTTTRPAPEAGHSKASARSRRRRPTAT